MKTNEPVTLESASQRYGKQAKAMEATYIEGQDVAQYEAAYSVAYEIGKAGGKLDYVMSSPATAYLSESQRRIAYETGAAANKTKKSPNDLKTSAKGGTINTESETFANESGEGIHLRDGGKRAGSSDTQREISRMEGGAGEAEGRKVNRRPADGEAAALSRLTRAEL